MTRVIKAHLSCQTEGAITIRPQRLICKVCLKKLCTLKSLIPNQPSEQCPYITYLVCTGQITAEFPFWKCVVFLWFLLMLLINKKRYFLRILPFTPPTSNFSGTGWRRQIYSLPCSTGSNCVMKSESNNKKQNGAIHYFEQMEEM